MSHNILCRLKMENQNNAPAITQKKRIWLALIPSLFFVIIVWLVFLIDYTNVFPFYFPRLGIYPREISGLLGVVFSPFVHSSFSHLLSNTLPLLILVWMIFYFYSQIALKSFVGLWLLSGLFTWIIGRDSYHIGASGLIFAIAFFLFFSGIFRKYIPLVAVSMIVAFAYGSMTWSIFPLAEIVDEQVSWEGHLSGAISGLIIGIIFRKFGPQKPVVEWEEEDDIGEAENSIKERDL